MTKKIENGDVTSPVTVMVILEAPRTCCAGTTTADRPTIKSAA